MCDTIDVWMFWTKINLFKLISEFAVSIAIIGILAGRRWWLFITTLSETYLLTKAAVFSLQEARDALQLQLAAGGPGHPWHWRSGDQHLGLLPRQDVPHQPRDLHLHVPALLVSPQEHHHDLDHLSNHGTVHGTLSRRLQTNLLPHFRKEIGFFIYKHTIYWTCLKMEI